MLKFSIQYRQLAVLLLGTLFAGISTIVNADTIARHVIATGGGQMTVGDETLTYTIGQPIISINSSSSPTAGFWPTRRDNDPLPGEATLAAKDISASSCKKRKGARLELNLKKRG